MAGIVKLGAIGHAPLAVGAEPVGTRPVDAAGVELVDDAELVVLPQHSLVATVEGVLVDGFLDGLVAEDEAVHGEGVEEGVGAVGVSGRDQGVSPSG